jgi:perosamine synthetase
LKNNLIKVATPITGEEEFEATREVFLSGNFVSGEKVAEFEKRFASYIGAEEACAVNSGTAALHIALAILGVGPGDEVIVPPLTFMSTVTSVLHQNAIPVFADIDKESFCLCPKDIQNRITERTKAIIPVHLFGNSANMDKIIKLAEENNLHIIEDCAQAHGTEYKGKKVGSIGDMGAFSFFATKHMTTGEGGIITSNNKEWITKARQIRSHGMTNRNDHEFLGYNYRMNELAAAIGLVQLKKLNGFNEKRIKNSLFILKALSNHSSKWFTTPKIEKHIKHTFFWCPLIINVEDGFTSIEVTKKLRDKGIEVRQRYNEPLYKQKVLQDGNPYPNGCPFTCQSPEKTQDYKNLYLPNVESIAGNIIGLPNHPGLVQEDLDYIVEVCKTLY